jgi:hypothetical protein
LPVTRDSRFKQGRFGGSLPEGVANELEFGYQIRISMFARQLLGIWGGGVGKLTLSEIEESRPSTRNVV